MMAESIQTVFVNSDPSESRWSSQEHVATYDVSPATGGSVEEIYLRHIVDHYDHLPEQILFLNSGALQRCPDAETRIRAVEQLPGFQPLGASLHVQEVESPQHALLQQIGGSTSFLQPPDFITFRPGSLFACSREAVHSHSLDVYRRALALVKKSVEGPRLLESTWHLLFDRPGTRTGVVTAADAGLFADLKYMILSLRESNETPVAIYDLGLSHEQLQWCLTVPGVMCRPLPPMSKTQADFVGQHRWQAWLKPTYIHDAPFDKLLWIDADCVVLSPLDELFQQIDEGPALMPEVAVGCGSNHADIYRKYLPIRDAEARGKIEMNNGVIGFKRCRDRELIDAWLYVVQWAIENPGLRHLFRWYDQGALLWAILRTENESFLRQCNRWNHPANHSGKLTQYAVENGVSLLDAIRAAHPNAGIVHWFGLIKLSIALNEELNSLFTSEPEAGESSA